MVQKHIILSLFLYSARKQRNKTSIFQTLEKSLWAVVLTHALRGSSTLTNSSQSPVHHEQLANTKQTHVTGIPLTRSAQTLSRIKQTNTHRTERQRVKHTSASVLPEETDHSHKLHYPKIRCLKQRSFPTCHLQLKFETGLTHRQVSRGG